MKTVKILLAFVMALTAVACDNNDENPVGEGQVPVTLKNFANTGCKGNSARAIGDSSALSEAIEYSCIHEGYLYLNHVDAIFNCCPGELNASVKVDGNLITVSEWSTEDGCKCICPYDLSYEIGPLQEGVAYVLTIEHKGETLQVADFVFSNTMSGTWKAK